MKRKIITIGILFALVASLFAAAPVAANGGIVADEGGFDVYSPGDTYTVNYTATGAVDLNINLADSDGLPDDAMAIFVNGIQVGKLDLYDGDVDVLVSLVPGNYEIVFEYLYFDFSPTSQMYYILTEFEYTGTNLILGVGSDIITVLNPGDTLVVNKIVGISEIPPKPDILFLADTTGSMVDAIANVKANASAIMAAVLAVAPDAQFGVANYKDYQYPTQYDPYVTQWQQQMTADTTAVQAAIDTWAAGGGYDGSEGWFASLDRAVNPGAPGNPGWRSGSTKIIVIFGDAPAHDPVPQVLTGLGYDITEASLAADLVAANIKVVAVSLNTGPYAAGLDDDPTLSAYDYPGTPGGTAGQASRIAAATGGAYLFAATPGDVATAILEGITSLETDVWATVEADDGLTVEITPDVYEDVMGPTSRVFSETISISEEPDVSTCYSATVTFWSNSYPEEGAIIGTQEITVYRLVIDIKPWSWPNSINSKNKKGVVPVAILGSETFDVTNLADWADFWFGEDGDNAAPAHEIYTSEVFNDHIVYPYTHDPDGVPASGDEFEATANDDLWPDLVIHFPQLDTGFAKGDLEGILTGMYMGNAFEASDAVRIIK